MTGYSLSDRLADEHNARMDKIARRRTAITDKVRTIDEQIKELSKERFALLEEGCDLWEEARRRNR